MYFTIAIAQSGQAAEDQPLVTRQNRQIVVVVFLEKVSFGKSVFTLAGSTLIEIHGAARFFIDNFGTALHPEANLIFRARIGNKRKPIVQTGNGQLGVVVCVCQNLTGCPGSTERGPTCAEEVASVGFHESTTYVLDGKIDSVFKPRLVGRP